MLRKIFKPIKFWEASSDNLCMWYAGEIPYLVIAREGRRMWNGFQDTFRIAAHLAKARRGARQQIFVRERRKVIEPKLSRRKDDAYDHYGQCL